MTLFAKAAAKIGQNIEKTSAQAVALLTDKVTPEVQKYRYDLCLSCDKLYVPTKNCKVCGCFMTIKTWMPAQVCPLGKWTKEKSSENSK